jgi:hypothetical protein
MQRLLLLALFGLVVGGPLWLPAPGTDAERMGELLHSDFTSGPIDGKPQGPPTPIPPGQLTPERVHGGIQ